MSGVIATGATSMAGNSPGAAQENITALLCGQGTIMTRSGGRPGRNTAHTGLLKLEGYGGGILYGATEVFVFKV